jgi:hypothetical protein
MSVYPVEVTITDTRWECGYTRPNGAPCRHFTKAQAELCIKRRESRDSARARRAEQKSAYLKMMAENRQIVAALLVGSAVKAEAEKYGRTPYYVTTIFGECVRDAIDHRLRQIVTGAGKIPHEKGALLEVRQLRMMRRLVTLTWARTNRATVEGLLDDWWPVVLREDADATA